MFSYANGKKYLHYDNYLAYRKELCQYYPLVRGKFRIDVELVNPTDFLYNVKVDRKPHSPAQKCYYCVDEWSTLFDIHEVDHDKGKSLRFLAETNNPDPTNGERFLLYSTSSSCWNEPWGRNKSNLFVFIRNQFWYVNFIEFLNGEWKGGIKYPLSVCIEHLPKWSVHEGNYTEEDYLPPTFLDEKDDFSSVFLEDIMKNPKNKDNYKFLADWLLDNDDNFGEYINKVIDLDVFRFVPFLTHEGGYFISEVGKNSFWEDMYRKRPKNKRTTKYIVLNLLQKDYGCRWPFDSWQNIWINS